jgi:hypothetical protein
VLSKAVEINMQMRELGQSAECARTDVRAESKSGDDRETEPAPVAAAHPPTAAAVRMWTGSATRERERGQERDPLPVLGRRWLTPLHSNFCALSLYLSHSMRASLRYAKWRGEREEN